MRSVIQRWGITATSVDAVTAIRQHILPPRTCPDDMLMQSRC
jgi:hypothetical protein